MMIPHVEIDEDRQVLIVAVPYFPSFIQDLRRRDIRGNFIKEKKHYEFSIALLPEVMACLGANFPKIKQTSSIALASLLSYLDEEDLLNIYRILSKKYRDGAMRELLVKTFGPFIHIEREIMAAKPRRRIEIDDPDDPRVTEEFIEDPSSVFAETVRDLSERVQAMPSFTEAERIRNRVERERIREERSYVPVREEPEELYVHPITPNDAGTWWDDRELDRLRGRRRR